MAQFQTIEKEAFAELDEKKSRFLAFLVPVEHFGSRLQELREIHRKANHHVTAFRRIHGDNHIEEGAKDDGEPAGTSGMPMLKVLIGRDLMNVGVIVVRYFGGTKLGAGGLARAYSGAASMAIDAATLVPWQRICEATHSSRFDQMSQMERHINQLQLMVIGRTYHEQGVDVTVRGPEEDLERLNRHVDEMNAY